jgi:outer membrane protein OmpA-like peptidoglycan-associated protein
MLAPIAIVAAAILALALSGVAPALAQALSATTAPAPQSAPVPLNDAVLQAANALFSKVNLPPDSGEKLKVVIDPLVDGVTGTQSIATQAVERIVIDLVRRSYPRFEVVPLTSDALDSASILFIGTFTPVNAAARAGGPKDAYRVWFTLIDRKSRRIVSKARSLSLLKAVDSTPTPYFDESPAWTRDPAVETYIKSCEGTKLGDLVEASLIERGRAAAYIAEAMRAYDAKQYADALRLFERARRADVGDQLRVYNGLYLAHWRMNRLDEAREAFGRIVDYGLANNTLAIKFLFRPGSTKFFYGNVSAPYGMWLEQIASRADRSNACLTLVGHASPTGSTSFNDRLSLDRAVALVEILRAQAPNLSPRLTARGVGFRETLVGTGRDDASDALDRRVEFRIASCATAAD